jgi:tRNA(fMet)-specific endonuclease VapC
MRYLLDTDHLSILQRQTGEDYSNLARRMAQYAPSAFAISIVTLHEQMLGSHAYINRARTLNEVVKGYEMMTRVVSNFKVLPIVSLDARAATAYAELESQGIQLAKMDARIAAIALSRQLTLLTRNHRDFSKVSGLVIEDWTLRSPLS